MIKIKLSTLLGERRWTQSDFAKKTGVRPATINEYYHEIVRTMNPDHLDIFCKVLDCKIEDLIEYIPDKKLPH